MSINKKQNAIDGRRSRIHISLFTGLLIVAVTLSIIQYVQKGEVTWLATGWRSIEQFGKQSIDSNDLSGVSAALNNIEGKASHAYNKLSKQAGEMSAGLSVEQISTSLSLARDGLSGNVIGVTDGDNIKVLDVGRKIHKVRLRGITAPERGQPFASESTDHLADMIAGKDVFVESSAKDKYGYLQGKVFVEGRDINLEQLKAGYARWERLSGTAQETEDQLAYEQAEKSARRDGIGIWAESIASP
jgi:endonuclease YncB( thermonuclease family)